MQTNPSLVFEEYNLKHVLCLVIHGGYYDEKIVPSDIIQLCPEED
jgi:hypothetical protein